MNTACSTGDQSGAPPKAAGPVPPAADGEPVSAIGGARLDRRATFPAPLPGAYAPSRYLEFLPRVFADNDFLRGFLLIFESMWEPLEWRQDHIDLYFDPRTCPACISRRGPSTLPARSRLSACGQAATRR